MQKLIVYCSVPDAVTGKMIATELVREGLCACVNQIPSITSYYIYEGEFNEHGEELLMIKSDTYCFERVQKLIIDLHPYDVPEIIATEIQAANEGYLRWLGNTL